MNITNLFHRNESSVSRSFHSMDQVSWSIEVTQGGHMFMLVDRWTK